MAPGAKMCPNCIMPLTRKTTAIRVATHAKIVSMNNSPIAHTTGDTSFITG